MPDVLVSIAHEGLAVMTIYFGLFLWYFDEAVLAKLLLLAGFGFEYARGRLPAWRGTVGHAVAVLNAKYAWST